MNLAPNSVSGRVVKISSSSSPFGVVFASSAKRTSKPSERPIQFFCISRTLSGQRSSVSSASSSSCEKLVILKNPLGELPVPARPIRAPAATFDDLLVREHGLVNGIPVHLRLLALDQSRLEKVEKHSLLMLVVVRIAGRDFPTPVQRQPH